MNDQPLTDGWTDTQKFRGYNIIPRHFLWRGINMEITHTCLLGKFAIRQDPIYMDKQSQRGAVLEGLEWLGYGAECRCKA